MNVIGRAFDAWVSVTSDEEAGFTLAFFRIALGLTILGSLLSAAVDGVMDAMWIDAAHGGALRLGRGAWLVAMLGGPSDTAVHVLFAAGLVSGLLVTLGALGRAPYVIALLAYNGVTTTNANTMGGYDAMIVNALFLLVFSGATDTLSIDARRKTGSFAPEIVVPAWPRYLLLFQLFVIYGATGLQKLSPVWTPAGSYSALYWVFQDPTWRRFDMSFAPTLYPVLQVMTFVTWHWELAAPLMVFHYWFMRTRERGGWLRRIFCRFDLRKPFVVIGVAIHLGIAATVNVGPFSFVSLAYYLLFLRPDEARRIADLFSRRRGAITAPEAR